LSSATGELFACTNSGIYVREESGWRLIGPGIVNAHIRNEPVGDRWLYVAQDEVGWLRPGNEMLNIERFPVPGLGESFGAIADGQGIFWAELGSGRVARIDPGGDRPVVEVFDNDDGIPDGWVQVFVVDGVARLNVAARVLRFDEATRRMVADDTFLGGESGRFVGGHGRPARDPAGRLWIAGEDGVRVIDDKNADWSQSEERMPVGLVPILFAIEDGGVVWMHRPRKLARFDPAMPEAPPVSMRAVISNMQFVGTSRTEYSPNEKIPPLAYTENSFVANFMVTGTPVGVPVNFEVNLAGVGDEWVSTGSGGSAVFNRLKEGEYTLRVRPRMGEAIGVETSLAFTVEPPWFRTYWAYSAYGLSIVCIVLVVAWVMSLLDRREKLRLAHLVDERTSEVNQTNSRLALQVDQTMRRAAELRESEERYRNLIQELEKRVKERTS
jgi:hypothetical protein